MARLFRDLKVNESDGNIYLTLYNRDGSTALRDVSMKVSSEIVQPGDNWTAAAANLLLRLDEEGQPQLALTPENIGAAPVENGMSVCIHQKSGTVHALSGSGENIRFAATADFTAGDTFTVNGSPCTAKTVAGDALWTGFFRSGAVVVCWKNGNTLTFNGGGLPAAEAAKLAPENLKTGVSITANGKTVTGTFTADANAAAGQILSGKTAYVKGARVTGTIPSRAAASYTPGTASQTIAAGQYLSGVQTIRGDTNLKAANIRQGISIFGIAGALESRIPVASVGYGRICSYEVGDESHPFLQIAASSGWADSNYGALGPTGIHGYGFLSENTVKWQCKKAGNYTIVPYGQGIMNRSGDLWLNAGDWVTMTMADTGDIYWRDSKAGGFCVSVRP